MPRLKRRVADDGLTIESFFAERVKWQFDFDRLEHLDIERGECVWRCELCGHEFEPEEIAIFVNVRHEAWIGALSDDDDGVRTFAFCSREPCRRAPLLPPEKFGGWMEYDDDFREYALAAREWPPETRERMEKIKRFREQERESAVLALIAQRLVCRHDDSLLLQSGATTIVLAIDRGVPIKDVLMISGLSRDVVLEGIRRLFPERGSIISMLESMD